MASPPVHDASRHRHRRTPREPAGAPRRRAAPFRRHLMVMAKAPVAGRVKTRLAAEAGLAVALRFTRHRVAAVVRRLRAGGAWHTLLAVTPDGAVDARIWPRGVPLLPQGGGDLGTRMQRLMAAAPAGPVIIVGTDIPDITPSHIAAAFRLLGRHDAVLGPARDGGYWLIGLKRRPHVPRPFAGVRWSSAHALADTVANLRGRSIALLPMLGDVDSASDLAAQAGCWQYVHRRHATAIEQSCS